MSDYLVVDDPDTVRMARELSELNGTSVPATLAGLLRDKLASCREAAESSVWRATRPHRPGPSAALLPRA